MKNPTNNDAYDVLFRSYELANKQIKEIQAQLALEQERNLNNVANADLQIAELQAEITRLRDEMQALVGRLMVLADTFRVEHTEEFDWCADRLREAISGEVER